MARDNALNLASEDLYSNSVRKYLERNDQGGVGDDVVVLVPFCDSPTSSCAHNMGIQLKIGSDVGNTYNTYNTRTITIVRPYSLIYQKKGSTPVDPAGPDCYQSGTKPCEST